MKTPRAILWAVAIALLVALPPVMTAIGETFYIDLVRRIMILAIAAVSLNLILGYGGLVSFGHAAYLGIGAYAVGILAFYGFTSGWLQWVVAIGASAVVALAIGAISIRTSGLYFIMITLAFTQMLYYLGISLEEFGGDDGMRLKAKSQFAGLIDLRDPVAFYYLALALMLVSVFLVYRIVNSRFGMVLRAAKSNEARTRAIGFSPYPYRLAAFVMAGAMCGLAGALYANHTNYIVPGLMSWQHSGDLMFMVILGGMASTAGPVLGAFAFIFTEEMLKVFLNWVAPLFGKRDWAEYWAVLMGPLLILSVIFFRRGLAGIFYKPDA
jgi:branched-chain amino acid transport system permease protein